MYSRQRLRVSHRRPHHAKSAPRSE